MTSPQDKPRIVTFYSYKGGTGRSMALANVAWILASNARKVLVVDWDLEAPGLHRYLHPYLGDRELIESTGVIDFVMSYAREAIKPAKEDTPESWYVPYANLVRHASSLRYQFTGGGTLDFIPSGRQGSDYAARVNSFNWSAFYEKQQGGLFLEAAKLSLRGYAYVLIDSRTGVSDTSGICTIQMPDLLVVCFTPNTQSIEGAAAVAASADTQRTRPDGTRTLRILPIMMRVLRAEKNRLDIALEIARKRFDDLLWHIPKTERDVYWGRMSVPQEAFYAFEEVLAVFADEPGLPNTMLASMEALTGYIERAQLAEPGLRPAVPLKMPRLEPTKRRAELSKFLRPEPKPLVVPTPPVAKAPVTPQPAVSVRPTGPRDAGSYKYWFYISYAYSDADRYLKNFIDALTEEVQRLIGSDGPVGFFDESNLAVGGLWPVAVRDALAKTRIFIPILTPRYVMTLFCAQEWNGFLSRQSSTAHETGILPVVWVPIPQKNLPAAVSSVQLRSDTASRTYSEKGLLYLMRLRKKYHGEYEQFLHEYAASVVDVGRHAPRLPAERLPELDELSNAFESETGFGSLRLNSVRIICLTRGDAREAKDWNPYHTLPIAIAAAQNAAAMELYPDTMALDRLVEDGAHDSEMVVILIEVEAFWEPEKRDLLETLGRVNRPTWAFLVIVDQQEDTRADAEALRDLVHQVLFQFPVRWIDSDEELRKALPETFERLRLQMINQLQQKLPQQAKLPEIR